MNMMQDRDRSRAVLEAKALLVLRAAKSAFRETEGESTPEQYHQALREAFQRCHIQFSLAPEGHYTCFNAIDVQVITPEHQGEKAGAGQIRLPAALLIRVGEDGLDAVYRFNTPNTGNTNPLGLRYQD